MPTEFYDPAAVTSGTDSAFPSIMPTEYYDPAAVTAGTDSVVTEKQCDESGSKCVGPLEWTKCALGQDFNHTTGLCDNLIDSMNHTDAVAACSKRGDGWRLPNSNEIQSLVKCPNNVSTLTEWLSGDSNRMHAGCGATNYDSSTCSPNAFDESKFPNASRNNWADGETYKSHGSPCWWGTLYSYWSSSFSGTDYAWLVNLKVGRTTQSHLENTLNVRCCRDVTQLT